jgi:hypothetical protein
MNEKHPEKSTVAGPPSPSLVVIEQSGESVKDSLTAHRSGASLTDSPDCSTLLR